VDQTNDTPLLISCFADKHVQLRDPRVKLNTEVNGDCTSSRWPAHHCGISPYKNNTGGIEEGKRDSINTTAWMSTFKGSSTSVDPERSKGDLSLVCHPSKRQSHDDTRRERIALLPSSSSVSSKLS